MLSIGDLRVGSQIVFRDEPYEVISTARTRRSQSRAVLKTKLRNLITGNVIDHSFQPKDSMEEANLAYTKAQYLYREGDRYVFMDEKTYEQSPLSAEQLGSKVNYLTEGTAINILLFRDDPVSIELPIKMTFSVTEAPPGIKGNTAQTGTKMVTLNTGLRVAAPLFTDVGDKVVVDTRTGTYVGRG
jgi:elongation factor P